MHASETIASETCHGTTVSVNDNGLLIEGPSGSGKSALALALMAFGAKLVADDRTRLSLRPGHTGLWAEAPPGLPAAIEARGLGLLPARLDGPVRLRAILRLDILEPARLPEARSCVRLGQKVALLYRVEAAHFPFGLLQFLKGAAWNG